MGSNGALDTSRTSSSMSSSPAHNQRNPHIINMNNYLSDTDNPDLDQQMAGLFDPTLNHQGAEAGRPASGQLAGVPSNAGRHNGTDHDDLGPPVSDDAAAVMALTRQDFLVSFLVDARGGSMKGCRFSGVKVRPFFYQIDEIKAPSSASLISRYILRLGQRGCCCFCAACLNSKMYSEI